MQSNLHRRRGPALLAIVLCAAVQWATAAPVVYSAVGADATAIQPAALVVLGLAGMRLRRRR